MSDSKPTKKELISSLAKIERQCTSILPNNADNYAKSKKDRKQIYELLSALRLSHNTMVKNLEELKSEGKPANDLKTLWKLTNVYSIYAVDLDRSMRNIRKGLREIIESESTRNSKTEQTKEKVETTPQKQSRWGLLKRRTTMQIQSTEDRHVTTQPNNDSQPPTQPEKNSHNEENIKHTIIEKM